MNVKFVAGIPKVGHVVSSLTFYISKYSSFQGDNLQSLSLSLSWLHWCEDVLGSTHTTWTDNPIIARNVLVVKAKVESEE
jgi:hypothetical protein